MRPKTAQLCLSAASLLLTLIGNTTTGFAQSSPFGSFSDTWHSPASSCGGCPPVVWGPRPYEVVVSGYAPCCSSPVVSLGNEEGCRPGCAVQPNSKTDGGCPFPGPCKGCSVNREELPKPKPIPDSAFRQNTKRHYGTEQVVQARRKVSSPIIRTAAPELAKRFPENDGWIPVSSDSATRVSSQRVRLKD